MHLAVFAPAFTFKLHESEALASSIAIGTQVRLASVVMANCRKKKQNEKHIDFLATNYTFRLQNGEK